MWIVVTVRIDSSSTYVGVGIVPVVDFKSSRIGT